MMSVLEELKRSGEQEASIFYPILYRPDRSHEREDLARLLRDRSPQVYDRIRPQIEEWIKVKHPERKFTAAELSSGTEEVLKGKDAEEFGVWVYYPWNHRLVHILPEEMFVEVRTSRNRNKITAEEQAILAGKRIAVIGLSVGQSVAYTLAQERICGELRLADFDTLELNNLNRIRSGLHNIGLPKVYGIARDIAELDPYLKVKCYPEGIHEENIDAFFTDGGKADLLIEESDSFDIKIIARYKARALGIPVLMEASDKCMVDVERFDLEPQRAILHGLVDHLNPQTLKTLKSTEEKIAPMLDVLGLDQTSVRLRASMVEIEQSINTWPQLASAVTMGGGITADVARRMLLGSFNESGRYYIDIESLIRDKETNGLSSAKSSQESAFQCPYFDAEKIMGRQSSLQPDFIVRSLVERGIMAPTAGNLQAWHWVYDAGILQLWHDEARSAGWSDPGNRLAELGLGAALENIRLTAMAEYGLESNIKLYPAAEQPLLKALVSFSPSIKKLSETEKKCFEAIPIRCSNRKRGRERKMEPGLMAKLTAAFEYPYALRWVAEQDAMRELGQAIAEVERHRFLHEQGHADFFEKEMRWTPEETESSADGIDINTLELSMLDLTGMKILRDPAVAAYVRAWNGGKALTRITSGLINSSSALLLMMDQSSGTPLERGMAMQRIWLMAHAEGLALHPVSAPVFFMERLKKENDLEGMLKSSTLHSEALLKEAFGLKAGEHPVFLFRVSYSDEPTARALRRSIDSCFYVAHPKI